MVRRKCLSGNGSTKGQSIHRQSKQINRKSSDTNSIYSFHSQIQSVDAQGCLVSYIENSEAVLHICHETIDNQIFALTDLGEIRNHELCMDADSTHGKVKTIKCHKMGGNQKWEYNYEVSVVGMKTKKCFPFFLYITFSFS